MYFIDVPHFIALFFNCGSLGLCLIFATINYVLVHIAFIAHSLPQPQILDFFLVIYIPRNAVLSQIY